ncbi:MULTISPECIES: putative ABC transporter permease [Ruminococcus]|uniref:Putative ABC-transporter type IV n=1 Tax=Ruminococcus flavefaciens TaxID=1265 RepID=A0A1M7LGM2_RUMFL|nr:MULTISPECIES: hypothetical protein [Ruminococcus]MCR4796651.1 putative ABC transporter permease [Ruminococcus sp.]SHM76605.1 Putative ABC-transporter type IV [Ruminococcus flavefaciens]
MKLSQLLFSFLMGYFCYSLIEIVMRGYTHWTMSLTGGAVLTILYAINSRPMTLIRSCIIGTFLITAIELTVGIFDNVIMHWNVWDYSDMPFNFLGQICIPFSLFWFVLCIPANRLCKRIRRQFGNKKAVPIISEQPM